MTKANRLTPRQDAFATHVALGKPLSEAYRLAGFKATGNAIAVNAIRLMKQAKVVTRVGSLQAKFDEARVQGVRASMTVNANTITEMLTEVFHAGLAMKQVGAAATAAMGLAKLHGLLVDKTEDVTRRAARSPDAPLEIEVEHWLTEQGVIPSPESPADASPESPDQRALEQRPTGHGALLPEPQPQGSESPESPESPDEEPRFLQ
jgi:hypothetical protein